MVDSISQEDRVVDARYVLGQLNTARREIHNLRQQIKSLRYIFEKDVNGIKQLIGLYSDGVIPNQREASVRLEPTTSTSQSAETSCVTMTPIGVISTGFPSKRGTPRQSGISKELRGKLILFNTIFTNPEHALNGLQEFSHMWILFHFHRNESTHVRAKVAPPRLNGARTGVFSTRSPHRPCPIGLSLVKIIRIEGNTILFEGVDTVDGTPVFDIKPYIPQYDNPLHVEKLLKREQNGNPSEGGQDSPLSPRDANSLSNTDNFFFNNVEEGVGCEPPGEDISRDEEIALRLQAEEFGQSSPHDESIDAANYLIDEAPGPGEPVDSVLMSDEDPRSSRLLDGADGPSTVCGTDLDFINRRLLNLRHDNSPVRMGVREAPDGEEGLESQSLRPSQTIGNIQNIPTASRVNTSSLQNLTETVDNLTNQFQVRIPDWITQPRSRSLSVIFNERALRQLNEIVNDKAEEQKRAIENVLKEDPRSVYLRQRWANQFYTFLIHDLHISCRFDDNRGIVSVFQIRPAGRICDCGEPEWQCLGHSPVS